MEQRGGLAHDPGALGPTDIAEIAHRLAVDVRHDVLGIVCGVVNGPTDGQPTSRPHIDLDGVGSRLIRVDPSEGDEAVARAGLVLSLRQADSMVRGRQVGQLWYAIRVRYGHECRAAPLVRREDPSIADAVDSGEHWNVT
jgi:hypothetical protein